MIMIYRVTKYNSINNPAIAMITAAKVKTIFLPWLSDSFIPVKILPANQKPRMKIRIIRRASGPPFWLKITANHSTRTNMVEHLSRFVYFSISGISLPMLKAFLARLSHNR